MIFRLPKKLLFITAAGGPDQALRGRPQAVSRLLRPVGV